MYLINNKTPRKRKKNYTSRLVDINSFRKKRANERLIAKLELKWRWNMVFLAIAFIELCYAVCSAWKWRLHYYYYTSWMEDDLIRNAFAMNVLIVLLLNVLFVCYIWMKIIASASSRPAPGAFVVYDAFWYARRACDQPAIPLTYFERRSGRRWHIQMGEQLVGCFVLNYIVSEFCIDMRFMTLRIFMLNFTYIGAKNIL